MAHFWRRRLFIRETPPYRIRIDLGWEDGKRNEAWSVRRQIELFKFGKFQEVVFVETDLVPSKTSDEEIKQRALGLMREGWKRLGESLLCKEPL